MKNNTNGGIITGVIAAIAASSCCIPPIIATVAGIGGASSSFTWIKPLRPYLIGFAFLSIGYAWYNYLKPKKEDNCGCDIVKPKLYQTKGFLIGMTLFATASISFPYYSNIFFTNNKKEVIVTNSSDVEKVTIEIEGMTCDACQNHVNHSVNELNGIVDIKTSYEDGNAIIQFDKTKTNLKEINKAINSTGYIAIEN